MTEKQIEKLERKSSKYFDKKTKETFLESIDSNFGTIDGKNRDWIIPFGLTRSSFNNLQTETAMFFSFFTIPLDIAFLPLVGVLNLIKLTGLWDKVNDSINKRHENKFNKYNDEYMNAIKEKENDKLQNITNNLTEEQKFQENLEQEMKNEQQNNKVEQNSKNNSKEKAKQEEFEMSL